MKLLEHPEKYKLGVRVLLLRGRPKDGLEENRAITRISHYPEQFDRRLLELTSIARNGERIYVSAGARDLGKAARTFRERQLNSEYDRNPLDFYQKLDARWASCLQSPGAQAEKLWMFDCDSPEDTERTKDFTEARGLVDPYWYRTKNGEHCIVKPFNKTWMDEPIRKLLHENAIMLWGWG